MKPVRSIFGNTSRLINRFLTTIKIKPPSAASREFFFDNISTIKEAKESDQKEELQKKYTQHLSAKAGAGNQTTITFLQTIDLLKKSTTEAVYIQHDEALEFADDNARIDYLVFLADMIAYGSNHVPQYRDYRSDVISHAHQLTKNFRPHTDGSITDEQPLDLLIFIGGKANGSYRTFILDHVEIIKNLKPESLEILQENIFCDEMHGVKTQPIIQEIFPKIYKINFSVGDVESWEWEMEKSTKKYHDTQVVAALEDLDACAIKAYKENKLDAFYIKENDILIFRNLLHGRDREGVPLSQQDIYRQLITLVYTQKENVISSATAETLSSHEQGKNSRQSH